MSADRWSRCPKCWDRLDPTNDLREDWEIRIDAKAFGIAYRADCRACDFKFEFVKTVRLRHAADGTTLYDEQCPCGDHTVVKGD